LQSGKKVDMSLAVGDVAVANPTRRIDYIFTNKQSKNSLFKVMGSIQHTG
jgi:endonuclease/exonuclease/phosphatase family metal-dependent hydrolase